MLRQIEEKLSKKKDPKIMEEVVMHLRSVRDNWKEVMKKAKG